MGGFFPKQIENLGEEEKNDSLWSNRAFPDPLQQQWGRHSNLGQLLKQQEQRGEEQLLVAESSLGKLFTGVRKGSVERKLKSSFCVLWKGSISILLSLFI